MSNVKTLDQITEQQINATGVVSLATRPNQRQANSQYGVGGLSAKELQKRFDNLSRLAIGRYNVLAQLLAGTYEGVTSEEAESILEYILAIKGDTEGNTVGDLSLKDVLDRILTEDGELKATDPTNPKSKIPLELALSDLQSRKVEYSDIVDNLVTNDSQKPLSAAQGAALRRMIEIGGGGSGGSGGFSSLEWTSEVDENKLVYAVRFGKVVVSIPFDPTTEEMQYEGNVQLNAIHPFTLGGLFTQTPFSAGFMYVPLKDNEKLFYVTKSGLSQYSYYGYCFTDGKTYFISGYEPNRWLQPVTDTTLLAAFEELHEYAQGIISEVDD